ncbi:MAG: 3-hydroxy-5-phosphonooxypentane-2,4-dione thiolase [Anaerohalosphaera sp.]|nr:3-hydroxy-5-phosphonooxypentane-2,4-dione thiolase [Anaerohalosphaera sp.]
MADNVGNQEAKDYGIGVPVEKKAFFLKGLDHADWGIKDRMGRIFDSKSSHTVMLAFDHGYIMGPTSGLERIDLSIVPLIEHADCIMCTRGVLRSCIPPQVNKPISLRYSAGTTVLSELNDECILNIEEAIRLNVSAMAIMVSVGGIYEGKTIENLVRTADMGAKYGIPTLGVTAVGKELARDSRYLSMASRVCAENGATFVKTYYCEEGFEKVTAACPVPIVIAGGKKLPELEALTVAWKAIQEGAAGVDMGRNVFQADAPIAMLKAVRGVVHDGLKPQEGLELYNTLKNE